MRAAEAARAGDIHYLEICFGFQLATVSFAREVAGMDGADTAELSPDAAHQVVHLLPEQDSRVTGGSLRLGAHDITVRPDTTAANLYGDGMSRRHRHRYEINADMLPELEEAGMVFSAHSDNGRRMEVLEVPGCRFYLGVQFHPEFSSRPGRPEPSFVGFVRAAVSL